MRENVRITNMRFGTVEPPRTCLKELYIPCTYTQLLCVIPGSTTLHFVCCRGCLLCLQSLAKTFPTRESTTTNTWSPTTLRTSVSQCLRVDSSFCYSVMSVLFHQPPSPSLPPSLLPLPSPPSLPSLPPTLTHARTHTHTHAAATSNWYADYWADTGGLSLTVNQTSVSPASATLQFQLAQVFERDWNSHYAIDIHEYNISQ